MRSISIRNVLRGLIAASLLAVGADVGFGHSVGRHYALSHACFLNDFDTDSPLGLSRNELRDCLFLDPGAESLDSMDEMRDCERISAMHDLRSHVNEFLHHRAPRITNEILMGFRTGFSWIGIVSKAQNNVVNQWSDVVLQLAETVGRSQAKEIVTTSSYASGNIFIYTFEEESNHTEHEAEINSDHLAAYNPLQTGMDPVGNEWQIGRPKDSASGIITYSHFEGCFANALEHVATSQVTDDQSTVGESSIASTAPTSLGSHSIPNACAIVEDNSSFDEASDAFSASVAFSVDSTELETPNRPPMLEGDAGIGHCSVAMNDTDVDLLANVPNYLANVDSLPIDSPQMDGASLSQEDLKLAYDRGIIDSWTSTDWNVRHWYFKSSSLSRGSLFYSSPHKRSLLDLTQFSEDQTPRILNDIPLDPALYPAINPESQLAVAQPTEGFWFSNVIASTVEFTKSQWQAWQPALEQSKKQSSRITAMQLRNIGMFFLKSASRLDASGVEAEVAGRDQTQR